MGSIFVAGSVWVAPGTRGPLGEAAAQEWIDSFMINVSELDSEHPVRM